MRHKITIVLTFVIASAGLWFLNWSARLRIKSEDLGMIIDAFDSSDFKTHYNIPDESTLDQGFQPLDFSEFWDTRDAFLQWVKSAFPEKRSEWLFVWDELIDRTLLIEFTDISQCDAHFVRECATDFLVKYPDWRIVFVNDQVNLRFLIYPDRVSLSAELSKLPLDVAIESIRNKESRIRREQSWPIDYQVNVLQQLILAKMRGDSLDPVEVLAVFHDGHTEDRQYNLTWLLSRHPWPDQAILLEEIMRGETFWITPSQPKLEEFRKDSDQATLSLAKWYVPRGKESLKMKLPNGEVVDLDLSKTPVREIPLYSEAK